MRDPKYNDERLSWRFYNSICNARDERIEDLNSEDLDTESILQLAEFQAGLLFNGIKDVVSTQSVRRMKNTLSHIVADTDSNERLSTSLAAMEVLDELAGSYVVEMQATAEERMLKVMVLAQEHLVGYPASHFLRMVSQAFMFGRDEECVILCRSVLEAVFQDAVSDRLCDEHPREKNIGRRNYGLADRLHAAAAAGLISSPAHPLAKKVKNRANDVLHSGRSHKPQISESEAWELLKATVMIVTHLSKNVS